MNLFVLELGEKFPLQDLNPKSNDLVSNSLTVLFTRGLYIVVSSNPVIKSGHEKEGETT